MLVGHKVRDALSEHSYAAEIAGVSYSLGASETGVSISLGGYNDKILELLDVVPTTNRLLLRRCLTTGYACMPTCS